MNINYDTLKIMGKFALYMVGILLLVYFVAAMTPWLAKKIDSKGNRPARVKKDNMYSFEKDGLRSIYEIDNDDDNKNDDKEVDGNGKR